MRNHSCRRREESNRLPVWKLSGQIWNISGKIWKYLGKPENEDLFYFLFFFWRSHYTNSMRKKGNTLVKTYLSFFWRTHYTFCFEFWADSSRPRSPPPPPQLFCSPTAMRRNPLLIPAIFRCFMLQIQLFRIVL